MSGVDVRQAQASLHNLILLQVSRVGCIQLKTFAPSLTNCPAMPYYSRFRGVCNNHQRWGNGNSQFTKLEFRFMHIRTVRKQIWRMKEKEREREVSRHTVDCVSAYCLLYSDGVWHQVTYTDTCGATLQQQQQPCKQPRYGPSRCEANCKTWTLHRRACVVRYLRRGGYVFAAVRVCLCAKYLKKTMNGF